MIHIHYTWVGPIQEAPIQHAYQNNPLLHGKQIFHDVSGPLSMMEHLKQADTTLYFWCMETYVAHYKNFFSRHNPPLTRGIEVHSIESLLKILNDIVKANSNFIENHLIIRPRVPRTIILKRWQELYRTILDFSELSNLEKLAIHNFYSNIEKILSRDDDAVVDLYLNLSNNIKLIVEYISYEYAFFKRMLMDEHFNPFKHFPRGAITVRYNVNIKVLMNYVTLVFVGGYVLDTNVYAEPTKRPTFLAVGNFKTVGIHTPHYQFDFKIANEERFNQFITGPARLIHLIYTNDIMMDERFRLPLPPPNRSEITSITLDVWLMSSLPYNSGAYLALVSFIKFYHFTKLYGQDLKIGFISTNILEKYREPPDLNFYKNLCTMSVISAARMGYALREYFSFVTDDNLDDEGSVVEDFNDGVFDGGLDGGGFDEEGSDVSSIPSHFSDLPPPTITAEEVARQPFWMITMHARAAKVQFLNLTKFFFRTHI